LLRSLFRKQWNHYLQWRFDPTWNMGHPGGKKAGPRAVEQTLDAWRFNVKPLKINLEQWRLTLDQRRLTLKRSKLTLKELGRL
jgi:hypothetical protein